MVKAKKQKPPPAFDLEAELNTAVAAKLAMCSDVWLAKLSNEGWIPKAARGRYRLIDVVHGRIKYLQDEGRRSSQSKSASRVQEARASQIEVQTKKELGDLIPLEDVLAWISETLGLLRTGLTGLPAACSRDPDVRAVIEKQLNDRITKFRDACDAASAALEGRKPIILDPEEGDT